VSRQPHRAAARELAIALHDLAWLLPRTLDPEAEPEPLPASELEVMRLLVRRPGLSVSDVARELALQTSNASTAVRTLVVRGLLERRRDDEDGRVTRLFPTARADEVRRRREQAWAQALRARLSELPDAEARRLLDAADALRSLADALAQ
jgi:DNA-binding MarR family transcriptional regulator